MKLHTQWFNRTFVFLIGALILSGISARASTVGFGENYVVSANTVVDKNLYVAGGTVILSSAVPGDALVAAGNATVSGPIGGDVFLVAGSAEVAGLVSGDVRAVAGTVSLTEPVLGDVALAAGNISLLPNVKISGDALLVGGRVSLLGDIEGQLYAVGGDVFIDGRVVGNAHIYSSGTIRLGPSAVIGGDVTYKSPREMVVDPAASIKGKTVFEYVAPLVSAKDTRGFFAGLLGIGFVARLLILMAAALFFVLVFRRVSVTLVSVSLEKFCKLFLVGFVVLVVLPFVSLLLTVTVFGSLVALALFVIWILGILLSLIYSGVLFAFVFNKYVLKRALPPVISWKAAVLGVFGLGVLFLVPYVGILSYFIFFVVSLGALSQVGYRHFLESR